MKKARIFSVVADVIAVATIFNEIAIAVATFFAMFITADEKIGIIAMAVGFAVFAVYMVVVPQLREHAHALRYGRS